MREIRNLNREPVMGGALPLATISSKGNMRLAGNGPRQPGFARSGRAYEQDAFRNISTDGLVTVGVLEKIHDLLQLPHNRQRP